MYLVLAIILGAYLFLRAVCEKAETKETRNRSDREFSEWSANRDSFITAYRDDELEHEVKMSKSLQNEAIELITANTPIVRPTYLMIKMIAMALHGKIPHECLDDEMGSTYTGDVIEMRQQADALISFMEWYNTLLRNNGVRENLMVYIPEYKGKTRKNIPHELAFAHTNKWSYITWPSLNFYQSSLVVGRPMINPNCINIK